MHLMNIFSISLLYPFFPCLKCLRLRTAKTRVSEGLTEEPVWDIFQNATLHVKVIYI